MCKVQVRAKHERQNDDYATENTNPNSSSLNDKAHHIRRRLSQTITSRHCLLIAIALASLSAHACDDIVELQVTCDSDKTTWVVPSHITQTDDTTETNPQMVTVGSCIDGRVADIAQVKGNDIDANTNGIVICPQTNVCYHLKRLSPNQIDVKNCDNDGDGDPICNYICYGGSFTRKGEAKPDGTAREPINGNIICDGSTDNAYTYECDGNIVKKTHCPLGCDENGNQCKTNICKSGKQYECKDGTLFKCGNAQDVATQVTNNMTCDEKGQVVSCDGNELKQETHPCADGKVAWCKPNEPTPLQTECYPLSQNDNFIACNNLKNTRRSCDENGEVLQEESCSNGQTKCADDLKGRVDCNNQIINTCQYCYNKNVNNTPVSIGELGCKGCVPNEYTSRDGTVSTLNPKDEVCYNGKLEQFGNAKGSNFLRFPRAKTNGLWDFALNVTPALSKEQSETPPTDQFVDTPNVPSKDHSVVPSNDQSKQTWQYYNCYNDAAMEFLNRLTDIDDAKGFIQSLSDLNIPHKCCDDENSYYITQTGYRYYSVEKCTNIRLQNTNNDIIDTNFSAYAYTTELNDFLIGIEDDLLAKDSACLEVRDKTEDTKAVRRMFIKQKTNGDQESKDGEPKHGIYKAFECPDQYKCDLQNPYNGLCINKEIKNVAKTIEGCDGKFKCNTNNTIDCIDGNKLIAECPKGTTPRIVGDKGVESSCKGQSKLKLDQIRCVPDGQFRSEQ